MNPTHSSNNHSAGNGKVASGQHDGGRLSNGELLEMASLDALGLLDEQERAAFEESLRAAPPSVRELVRTNQTLAAAGMAKALPEVQPAASLRERVLAKVRATIAADAQSPSVVGRIAPPQLAPSRGVAPFWRAAAIGSMAAAVLFAVVTVQMSGQFSRMNDAIRANAVAEKFIKDFGPRFETALTDSRTKFVQFAQADGVSRGSAVLLLNAESGTGQLFCRDLPLNTRGFRLQVIDDAGKVVQTVPIAVSNDRAYQELPDLAAQAGRSMVITAGEADAAVLKSNNL